MFRKVKQTGEEKLSPLLGSTCLTPSAPTSEPPSSSLTTDHSGRVMGA